MPLDWCTARTRTHREHLSTFRCTDPVDLVYDEETGEEVESAEHDFPWEFEVQERINSLHVPVSAPTFLILGYDGERLAAVLELHVQHFDSYCWVSTVAVANWAKGRGHAVVAITEIVHRVMGKYGITDRYVIEAHIDRDNEQSQKAFAKAGFESVETRDGYQLWAKAVREAQSVR